MDLLAALICMALFGGDKYTPVETKNKRKNSLMRFFNSVQLVGLFSSMPFLINWLAKADFPYQTGAFWTAIVVYILMAIGMSFSVYDSMRKDGPLDW